MGSRRKKKSARRNFSVGGNDIRDEDLESFKVLRSKKNVEKVNESVKILAKRRKT